MEAAVGLDGDLPGAPDALAFPEAAIKHVVGAHVRLGPVALAAGRVVAAFDEKTADIIDAGTAHVPVAKRELELHSMPVTGEVIVEARPRAGGEERLVHSLRLIASRTAGITVHQLDQGGASENLAPVPAPAKRREDTFIASKSK